ncbi:MAG TPA: RdgB/HAM1 family non-canonical purine NTP pyrophosphatase [Gammaproteobacteria bacterium]|nr:RdgB/HAM1 family non-canonical purine NTP pyrophosphatase [Gammaproteobacteria bacterium]
MTRVVVATGNRGKLAEIRAVLAPAGIDFVAQSDFDVEAAEETGLSFVENAILKARHAARETGLPALADDSGLEVDALAGAPGIHSARYAGDGASDRDNVIKLLTALKDIPVGLRSARFQCVIVLLRHAADPTPLICQGTWEGRIAIQPAGDNGFGYDPVFMPAGFDCTAAELDKAEKNRLSHRGQALAALLAKLQV